MHAGKCLQICAGLVLQKHEINKKAPKDPHSSHRLAAPKNGFTGDPGTSWVGRASHSEEPQRPLGSAAGSFASRLISSPEPNTVRSRGSGAVGKAVKTQTLLLVASCYY